MKFELTVSEFKEMFNTLQSPHELLALLRVALEQNLSLLHNDKDFDKIASVVDLKLYRL